MRKARASLITSIMIGLFAVTTAGVSTYAWFQANASATITATGDTTTITVSAPDDIEVSNTAVYLYRGNPSGKNVTSHFTLVNSVGARTVEDFYPGDLLTIAIKVTAGSNINSGSMDLTYWSFSNSQREIYGSSGYVVNIASAIKVSAAANGTGSYPSVNEVLSPINRDGVQLSSLTLYDDGSDDDTRYYFEDDITDAIDGDSIGTTTGYFFYTIEFLNTRATFYKETDSSGNVLNETPADDEDTRFFTGNNSGSSTCYEGLRFFIKSANITIS